MSYKYYERGLYESKEDYADCYSLDEIKSKNKFDYLERRGYSLTKHFDLKMKEGFYLTKNQRRESTQHAFLIWAILKYLKENDLKAYSYKTIKPDIIIDFQNRKIAIEVETGKILKNNKRQFLHKVELLRKNYGWNWFFVVTNRDLVSKYKKFGKTYTRKNVIKGIWKYVNFKPKFHSQKEGF